MKKYYYIFRVSFMENLQYPMNSILGFISYFFMIFVFFQLWNYIYTDPSAIIAGYTRQQMIWYVIFTEIMWYGTRSTTLTGGMSRDIKSGTVAYSINKPYYYPLHILAKYLGEIGFRFLLYSILGSLLGLLLLGAIPGFHFVTITAVVPVMFLGLLINSLIRINISILSFWVEDALPFQWLYDKLLIVLGIMFPVEVFPDILQPIIRVLPIYAVTYGPAKLVVDFSAEVLVKILLVQGSYLGILTLIMVFLYEKGVRKLMLTAVKNQGSLLLTTVKYNIMREMTNKTAFIMNVLFMMLNNSTFIIQWMVILHLKKEIGGYGIREIMTLWALSASAYGFAHIFFHRAFSLSELITEGKLDAFLVQPKNVLISAITSTTSISAIGDLVYGFVLIFFTGISLRKFLLFTLFTVTGGFVFTAFAVIAGSLSFWIVKGDYIAGNLTSIMVNFSTYPDGIFKGAVKVMLFTIIPIGFYNYLPVKTMISFRFSYLLGILFAAVFMVLLAFLVFHKGLKRYSSGNLMSARI